MCWLPSWEVDGWSHGPTEWYTSMVHCSRCGSSSESGTQRTPPFCPPVSLGMASFGLGFLLFPVKYFFLRVGKMAPEPQAPWEPAQSPWGWGPLIGLGQAWVMCSVWGLMGWNIVYFLHLRKYRELPR